MEGLHDQVLRAFEALQKLEQKDEEELLPEDPTVTVVFQLWEAYHATSPFPITISVRHPLYVDSVFPVRVITKDPQEEWKEKFKEALPPFPIKSYSVSKWRRRFTTAADRRQLIKETRIFVADSRIGHVLGDILGQDFYNKKKAPVMIDLTGDDVVKPIAEVLECTTAVLPKHDKFASAIGRLSWAAEDIADNACDVVEAIFDRIGKDKIAAAYIRTPGSLTLPIYTADISSVLSEQ